MTRSLRHAFVLALALVASACAAGSTPADTAADKAAIDALRTNFAAALSAGDIDKLMSLYANDAIFMQENLPPITGHDASPEATVIAVAASSPGATKSMYGTPRDAPEDLFTSVPSPIPRAPR